MNHSFSYKLLTAFFLTTTVGIVIYTMYAAFHYSSNAILGRDEANYVILSSQKILASTSVSELFKGMIANKGPHMTLGMQMVNMFTYFTFGALDRRIMNVIGVMIFCGAAFLLPKKLPNRKMELILICATLFPLILSPAHNACIVNVSCTCNHYLGIAASVISLYFFTRMAEKRYFFIPAEIFMLIGICSLGASLAMIPISFIILFLMPDIKKWRYILLNFLCIALVMLFHYYASYPHTVFELGEDAGPTSISTFINNTIRFALTFFIIMGSMFYWLNDAGYGFILAIIGLITFIAMIVALVKCRGFFRSGKESFYYYGIALMLIMIVTISLGRYYTFGSSRYAAYTAFLYAMLLLLLFYRINQSDDVAQTARRIKILLCSSTLSLVYFFTALHYHQPYLLALEQKDNLCRDMWHRDGYACGVMITHEEATRIIKGAIDQGIYRVEQ